MCLCTLLISLSRGKLHQMHLLGNGAQRELLTSRLRRRRLNYRAYPELMILYYCLRNNAVFLILWASAGKGGGVVVVVGVQELSRDVGSAVVLV